MSYQSPITMYTERILKDIVEKQDAYLVEEVRKVGFDIDKDELAKALKYDREQYEQGYSDGVFAERNKPIKTNADRFRAMTDEELAVVIAWPYIASPPWCSEHKTCPYISEDPTPCDKCALDWLKQEATE